jgi:heptosyltransferase II
VLCFFAPTSGAEIELYGRGEKVLSTSADYCSYRRDADTGSLTVERLLEPALRLLGNTRRV